MKKNRQPASKFNFWQPATDMMSGLVFVLILVIVIALLLIFKNQLIDLINTIFDKIVSESSGI